MTVARIACESLNPSKLGDATFRGCSDRLGANWRAFSFGDSPELADELAALVLAGTKTATSSAFSDGPSTEEGSEW
jgi:uncharacterized protein YhfF